MLERLAALAERDTTLLFATGLWLVSIQISIAAAGILLTGVVFLWLYQLAAHKRIFLRLPVDVPAVLFVVFSLASAVFSFDPRTSLVDVKKLVLLIIPYLIVSTVRRPTSLERMVLILIAVTDLAALLALWQYFYSDLGDLDHRIRGFMSHYMTFSGLLMVVGVVALAELLFRGKWRGFLLASLALILPVLLLTLTRSAWLGTLTAALVLLFLKDRRLLIAVPALVLAVLYLTPPEVDERIQSFTKPDRSGKDRLFMLQSGMRMAANHPWLGVGPDMVSLVYPIYLMDGAPEERNVHLHNNLAQIAAERGLPCLGAWLWLMGGFLIGSVRGYRRPALDSGGRALAAGALGAAVAGLAAGLFEYNFGDSEFLMLFLFILTIPFVLEGKQEVAAVS